ARRRRRARLRLGRRRHERQHPHDPLRRRLHRRDRLAHLRRTAAALARGRQALRERRHRRPRRHAARRHRRRRPARGPGHRRLRAQPREQLQPAAPPGRRRRRRRRAPRDRATRDDRRPPRPRPRLTAGPRPEGGRASGAPRGPLSWVPMSESGPPSRLRVGLLGCGTVGTEVVRLLLAHAEELSQRAGVRLELSGIAVRSLETERDPVVPRELLTTDAESVVAGSDVVVELLAGVQPARDLLARAVAAGTPVVSGNKAVLATSGPELYEAAEAAGAGVFFEAAVAGAVPVVRGIRESLAGDRITRVLGIVNGTTNFILDEMTREGSDFADVLTRAQELGYAEADPTADVGGHDAAAKAAILASLAFHSRVAQADVPVTGITDITPDDIEAAAAMGYTIKLLA